MKNRQGLTLVYTGPGKGKTTAGVGAAVRAAGGGFKVLFLQFIKNRDTGEMHALKQLGVVFEQLGLGMIKGREPSEADIDGARKAFGRAAQAAAAGEWDLIVMDEICVALKYGLLDSQDVIDLIRSRPEGLHLILTGRHCPPEVMEAADTVTILEMAKHHYQSGVKAQAGIEY